MATPKRAPGRRGGNPALKLAAIRKFHVYLGVFIAPSILMFAISGALQVFRLHEANPGYQPPALVEKLGRLHKDQVFAVAPPKRARPPQAAGKPGGPARPEAREPVNQAKLALQWFAIATGATLTVSTLLGLWMALAYNGRKGLMWLLLAAGVAAPVAMILLA